MADWESWIDRKIRQAMEEGAFDALPRQGQPLDLGDDAHTPEDLRLSYKIMKDNQLAPDWITASKAVADRVQAWQKALAHAVSHYQTAQAEGSLTERPEAELLWRKARTVLNEQLLQINQAILTLNLKLPAGVAHRPVLDFQREVDRLLG